MSRFASVAAIILGLFWIPSTAAQDLDDGPTSLGFSAPDSTQPIQNYRLPSWQWSTWTLSANGRADRSSIDRDLPYTEDRNDTRSFTSLSLRPAYRSLWESEAQTAFLQLLPQLNLQRDVTEFAEEESDRERYWVTFPLRGALRDYTDDQTFFLLEGDGHLESFWDSSTQDAQQHNNRSNWTTLRTNVRLNTRVGVGGGRVRVVTPVIRALRVQERLQTVAPGVSLSDEQLQTAARQLARQPGYQAVYDRSDKYFWRDFFNQIGTEAPGPFETFYVADVLREPLGIRREGAELQAGPFGTYRYQLRRLEEDQLSTRSQQIQGIIGGFVQGRWYRNVTLNHQIGADADLSYGYFVENRGSLGRAASANQEIEIDLEGQWLWVLADRVRLDNRLRTQLSYLDDPQGQDGFQPYNQYSLSSDLRIFVENSLSLTAGANVRYRHDGVGRFGSSSEFDTSLRFRIEYFLSRALE